MAIGTGFDDEDETLGITTHELAYLATLVPGERAALAQRRLGLPTAEDADPTVLLAGASTLLVRGLAEVTDEEKIVPDSAAALIAIALNESVGWAEIALLDDADGEAFFVAIANGFSVVLSPRALGICEVRFLEHDEGTSASDVLAGLMLAYVEAKTPGAAFLSVLDAEGEQAAAMAVRRLEGGEFEFSRDEGEGGRWSAADAVAARPRLSTEVAEGLARAA